MGRRRPPRCPSLSSRHIERALCAVRRRALADYYACVQFVDCHVPLLLDPVTNNMKGGMYGDVSVGIFWGAGPASAGLWCRARGRMSLHPACFSVGDPGHAGTLLRSARYESLTHTLPLQGVHPSPLGYDTLFTQCWDPILRGLLACKVPGSTAACTTVDLRPGKCSSGACQVRH